MEQCVHVSSCFMCVKGDKCSLRAAIRAVKACSDGKEEKRLHRHLMRTRAHAGGRARTHTQRENECNNNPCVSAASHVGPDARFSPSLSSFSLLSLSPSQVNCGHVIKRPSLYPLTLVNEKMGNKKQFCAANMEKIDNRERCVRLSPLMSQQRHWSRSQRK